MSEQTLYLIGGTPRCGKTEILQSFIERKPTLSISSDAIRAGVRRLHRLGEIDKEPDEIEDVLPWQIIVGLIERYDHPNISVAIEGVVITPERIAQLNLKNLQIKAAFVGFSSLSYVDHIVEYGKKSKDYIFDNIQKNNGDETEIRNIFLDLLNKDKDLRDRAQINNFAFFEADKYSFETHKANVVDHLLS